MIYLLIIYWIQYSFHRARQLWNTFCDQGIEHTERFWKYCTQIRSWERGIFFAVRHIHSAFWHLDIILWENENEMNFHSDEEQRFSPLTSNTESKPISRSMTTVPFAPNLLSPIFENCPEKRAGYWSALVQGNISIRISRLPAEAKTKNSATKSIPPKINIFFRSVLGN